MIVQSSCLRLILMPFLYETVVLKSSRKCRIALEMLGRRKDLCKFVKKLAVRPNYYLSWPRPDEFLQEQWVVRQLETIAEDLENMHTFDWDGLELPEDRLWETLRLKCALLSLPSEHSILIFRIDARNSRACLPMLALGPWMAIAG